MTERRLTAPEMTLEEWILDDTIRVIAAMDWLRRHPDTFRTICTAGCGGFWGGAMGIDWMSIKELSQAIPPAYTEYVGRQLLKAVES